MQSELTSPCRRDRVQVGVLEQVPRLQVGKSICWLHTNGLQFCYSCNSAGGG